MDLIPENLFYTEDHEWIAIEKNQGTVGITDFAQKALGDVVYIELPEVGSTLQKGKAFGVVESIKSVSDLFAPINGEVMAVNTELVDSPEKCNKDPYGEWLIKIKLAGQEGTSHLLNHSQYKEHCQKSS